LEAGKAVEGVVKVVGLNGWSLRPIYTRNTSTREKNEKPFAANGSSNKPDSPFTSATQLPIPRLKTLDSPMDGSKAFFPGTQLPSASQPMFHRRSLLSTFLLSLLGSNLTEEMPKFAQTPLMS